MQPAGVPPSPPATWIRPRMVSEQMGQIIEAALDAIVVVDAGLRIVAWNAAAEATFGWSAVEAIGREVVDMVPERLRGTYRLGLPAAMDAANSLPALGERIETMGLRSDGAEFPAQISLRAIRSGGDVLLVAYVRDVSDRRAAAAQATAAENHARFLANMSHELRTPLNLVLGFAQLLARDDGLSEAQRRYVGHIMDGGGRLLDVIDDILDLDRIGAGDAELHLERVPLRPLLESIVERLNPLAAASGVRLQPSIAGSPVVETDTRRVDQIVANLLSNAIQFTPDGGLVTVAAQALDRSVEIAVTDTGVGIPLAHQDRIFDPFAQVDTRLSRSHSGAGLGLALARRLAGLLGGDLTVSSVVGSGSTFRLVLPSPGRMTANGAGVVRPGRRPASRSFSKSIAFDGSLAP